MSRNIKDYETRAEAVRLAKNAYDCACDILGKHNVEFDVDMENRRCTLITPDIMGCGHNVIHYTWSEDVK